MKRPAVKLNDLRAITFVVEIGGYAYEVTLRSLARTVTEGQINGAWTKVQRVVGRAARFTREWPGTQRAVKRRGR